MSPRTVFFDLDGVLANFDKAAEETIGTDNIYKFEFVHGQEAFWRALNTNQTFFRDMEVMPGALRMLNAVRSTKLFTPINILTALPKVGAATVDAHKRHWVAHKLGRYGALPVITCLTHEKPDFCNPGDVLVDDRAVNKAAWEAKGGRYIVHTDVENTLGQLRSLGLVQ